MQGAEPVDLWFAQVPDLPLIRRRLITLLSWLILAMALWLVGRLVTVVGGW